MVTSDSLVITLRNEAGEARGEVTETCSDDFLERGPLYVFLDPFDSCCSVQV